VVNKEVRLSHVFVNIGIAKNQARNPKNLSAQECRLVGLVKLPRPETQWEGRTGLNGLVLS